MQAMQAMQAIQAIQAMQASSHALARLLGDWSGPRTDGSPT
ncbi:hypothetical protein [Saccharopolyspora pogona]|nr:hypothetical protein [Saccharopolyspora pogona]